MGKERLTARTTLGTLVAAAGVVYLIDPLRASLGGDTMAGNLLLVVNTASLRRRTSPSRRTSSAATARSRR